MHYFDLSSDSSSAVVLQTSFRAWISRGCNLQGQNTRTKNQSKTRLFQVNNSPRANVFPAGVANFGKVMQRSLERSPLDSRDGFFLYSAQASFSWPRVDLARLLRWAYSRPFWIRSFDFVKVCGIRFSIWESFIGFYICCDSITTILACLFSVGVRRKTPLLDLPWDV